MINNKILFVSRLQNYYLFINSFDYLDYNFIPQPIKVWKPKSCEFLLNNINRDNYLNLYIQGLNLEWNCIQKSYLKFKSLDFFNQTKLLKVTIRKYKLYQFLDHCKSLIFINNSFFIKNNTNNCIIKWSNSGCNPYILNYFFYKKLNLVSLIIINFNDVGSNNKISNLSLLP